METARSSLSPYTAAPARQVPATSPGRDLEPFLAADGKADTSLGWSFHPLRRYRPEYFRAGQLRRNDASGRGTATHGGREAGIGTPLRSGIGDCQASAGETVPTNLACP